MISPIPELLENTELFLLLKTHFNEPRTDETAQTWIELDLE